jgi:hypothetical protein
MPVQYSEILISSGLHQFQHGRIESIDTTTEIPFAHVALRGSKGQLLQRSGAYVPLKYCVELDDETCKQAAAQYKAVRKARRLAAKEAEAAAAVADQPIDWT